MIPYVFSLPMIVAMKFYMLRNSIHKSHNCHVLNEAIKWGKLRDIHEEVFTNIKLVYRWMHGIDTQ
jgi:hypothetical protein